MKYFLKAYWENLIMANYAIDPRILTPYLPEGVSIDFYKGKAYVSLVGFMFKKTRLFGVPIPVLGTFEEVNLRFYVKRTINGEVRRGVVFINETVPFKFVAWMANKLYKEHYISIPTQHKWSFDGDSKNIQYQWKPGSQWNKIVVEASADKSEMEPGSIEQFIFEHYYGYTRVNNSTTQEYRIEHPSWMINRIRSCHIECDFGATYGNDFTCLNEQHPDSVMLAEGSAVAVKWKRENVVMG